LKKNGISLYWSLFYQFVSDFGTFVRKKLN